MSHVGIKMLAVGASMVFKIAWEEMPEKQFSLSLPLSHSCATHSTTLVVQTVYRCTGKYIYSYLKLQLLDRPKGKNNDWVYIFHQWPTVRETSSTSFTFDDPDNSSRSFVFFTFYWQGSLAKCAIEFRTGSPLRKRCQRNCLCLSFVLPCCKHFLGLPRAAFDRQNAGLQKCLHC